MPVIKIPRKVLLVLLFATLVLAACGADADSAPTLDINAINTAIVGTTVAQLSAQFTATALAAPPTPTPLPTDTPIPLPTFGDSSALPTISLNPASGLTPLAGFTPLASPAAPAGTAALGDSCNNNVFEGDITIPDGSTVKPGSDFLKIWKIRNTGTCTWDEGYALVYIGGSKPDLDPMNFEFTNSSDFVASGNAINIAVNLTAPCIPGNYEGHWRMRSDSGYYFGTILSVYVVVKENCP
jgi:hypothetical protein